ncbi:hypothetical protein COV17_03275 [Candidatus Woesearchaeota archaeon CG10_big_fil_rev_8_21_14_0_10_36_11]|nr:MAG: hypothetical protein COV17_03275 [Candidatus Woesearchaeota archaeon CG10_big_fil_rev_8_21_14_0_10_36_11]
MPCFTLDELTEQLSPIRKYNPVFGQLKTEILDAWKRALTRDTKNYNLRRIDVRDDEDSLVFAGTGNSAWVVIPTPLSTSYTSLPRRTGGGIRLNLGGTKLHIDPGPQAIANTESLLGSVIPTDGIVVTHVHLDNASETFPLIYSAAAGGSLRKTLVEEHLRRSLPVLVSNKTFMDDFNAGTSQRAFYESMLSRRETLQPGESVTINGIKITATPAVHNETPNISETIGLLIEYEGIRIGYTGNTALFKTAPVKEWERARDISARVGPIEKQLETYNHIIEAYEGVDILIAEMGSVTLNHDSIKPSQFLRADGIYVLAKAVKPKMLFISEVAPESDLLVPIDDEVRMIAHGDVTYRDSQKGEVSFAEVVSRTIENALEVPTVLTYDGMVFKI